VKIFRKEPLRNVEGKGPEMGRAGRIQGIRGRQREKEIIIAPCAERGPSCDLSAFEWVAFRLAQGESFLPVHHLIHELHSSTTQKTSNSVTVPCYTRSFKIPLPTAQCSPTSFGFSPLVLFVGSVLKLLRLNFNVCMGFSKFLLRFDVDLCVRLSSP
jgi:hypothetical protein